MAKESGTCEMGPSFEKVGGKVKKEFIGCGPESDKWRIEKIYCC